MKEQFCYLGYWTILVLILKVQVKCGFYSIIDVSTRGVLYLPVYNAHFFPLKSTFKFTMRIIHGFHCLVKKTKEDKSFVVYL